MAKRRRLIPEYDSEDVNNEFYENCKEDRERARKLYALIVETIENNAVSFEEGASAALKAIEVMQKSNEQLMKLSQAVKKPVDVEEEFSPSTFLSNLSEEEEREEIFAKETT